MILLDKLLVYKKYYNPKYNEIQIKNMFQKIREKN